ncbi:hypothetical protein INR49_019647 [Caranx melampygus]|nr:hypothetical protein INR49_019647 [Caranx melampygus]
MSSALTLDFENHQLSSVMDSEAGTISIDHGGEWDISLFDELESLGDADELLEALGNSCYANVGPDLDFDIDIPPWNEADTSSTCTDGEVSVDSLSPAHTLSSVPSPASEEALSPYSIQDEALSPQSQASPISVCSESSGFSEISSPVKTAPKRTNLTTRAKPAQPIKRPIQIGPKVSIQPKPLITAVPLAPAAAPLQAKTIIIQPLQTTVLPVVKPSPVNIQPAPPPGRPIVLSQASQVLQIQTAQTITGNVVTMPTLNQDRPVPVAAPPVVSVALRTPSSDDDSKLSQRQQRMIKNRESASLSRKKKKEYLLSLEARLQVALSENEALKCENGNLKRQLEGLLNENTVLKTTAPKRRAVCLMVVLVFLVLNVGPMSLFQGGPGSKLEVVSSQHSGRHLLGFSPEEETQVEMGPEPLGSGPSDVAGRIPGSELQVYYAPYHTYSNFFDELNRRGDTFYVVSFRRDHLLLPATNHNNRSRPKMSVVLPAMNINDSIIRGKEFEVMMQIDCEVTDTRILHIRSSTIPPLLRVNHTDTFYQHSPTDSQAVPPVGVLMGSA